MDVTNHFVPGEPQPTEYLFGNVEGHDQEDIRSQAEDIAKHYFGTDMVSVEFMEQNATTEYVHDTTTEMGPYGRPVRTGTEFMAVFRARAIDDSPF